MKQILEEALRRVRPTIDERDKIEAFCERVVEKLRKKGYGAELEGSLAKDTWVSGNHDVDIFMFFEKSVSREELEKTGLEVGKKVIRELGGKPEIAYAEHPYARGKISEFDLDIVPCYRLESAAELQCAVDRTPFHTEYVQRHMTEEEKGQVRLLKQFMKGVGIYSAKEKVRGFSGYLCELLILKYGSFEKLLKTAKDWEYGTVIDLEKYYKSQKAVREKFNHSLNLIDPTDMNRDVAAALDDENFGLFVYAAREFLKRPSMKFFFPNDIEPLKADKLKKKLEERGEFLAVKFKTPKVVEDILYPQLRRSLKSLKKQLEAHEFGIIDAGMFANGESYFVLEFESLELPEIQKLAGPPITMDADHIQKFTDKYSKNKPWVEDDRWWVEVPRKFTNADKLVKHLLKDPQKVGMSSYVSKSILKKYSLLDQKKLFKEYKGDFAEFFTQYLTKKKPWEW